MEVGIFPAERSGAVSSLFFLSVHLSPPHLAILSGKWRGGREMGGKKSLFFRSRQHSQGLYLYSSLLIEHGPEQPQREPSDYYSPEPLHALQNEQKRFKLPHDK